MAHHVQEENAVGRGVTAEDIAALTFRALCDVSAMEKEAVMKKV